MQTDLKSVCDRLRKIPSLPDSYKRNVRRNGTLAYWREFRNHKINLSIFGAKIEPADSSGSMNLIDL
ncbi:hypothetical protein CH380_11920 [Leptospira adleri]|uniref:Uncharacterized protein n=1 Tax=Leptospira adleri TaxID=2023186 RepID=A0A2M9YNJ1_9LEPT|nr:hypothetical protein CH380_11920 [Leptospira adleri]PJZ62096.1 hypothetical protein CH376_09930 [Leptospira adleri]